MSASASERHSGREQALIRPTLPHVMLALFAALMLAMPWLTHSGLLYLVGTTLILGVYAIGWNFLFGWAGLASFGSGGLFAIGAYVSAVLLRAGYGPYFLLVIVAATLAGAAVALLVGLVSLRRTTGIFLAILTLSLAELLRHSLVHMRWLGGEDGISNIARPAISLGFLTVNLATGANYYWFLCAACALMIWLCWWLAHGPLGRRLLAVRHDAERASFVGIDIHREKLTAFVISAAVAACAGAIYAPWAQIVTPELSGMVRSTQPILFTLLGGIKSFWGPMVGAFAFMAIDYATRTLVGIQEMISGAILLAVILAFRNGLAGGWHSLVTALTSAKRRT